MLPAVEESSADPSELEKQAPRSTRLAAKFADTGDNKNEYVLGAWKPPSSGHEAHSLFACCADASVLRSDRRVSRASVRSVGRRIWPVCALARTTTRPSAL
jgi:hypothetical protein